jgi:hypothetical protein
MALPPEEQASFASLFAALALAFDREGRPGGDAAASALRAVRGRPYRPLPATTRPEALLDRACGHADALPVARLILACRTLIAWTNWEGEGLSKAVSSRLHTAELVGPDGHVDHADVRVGLLISDQATDYPVSRHAGEETYLVVSGTAAWSAGGGPYQRQAPGTLIHHPAWAPHGRRTLDQPFLGAWRWSGDLDLASFRVDEN